LHLGRRGGARPPAAGPAVSSDPGPPVGFVGSGSLLKAFDPVTGAWLWSVAMPGTIRADPLPARLDTGLGVVLVPLSGCHLACVRAADGSTLWNVDLRMPLPDPADELGGAPAIQLRALSDSTFRASVPNDLVFVATHYASTSRNRVYALNANDGSTRWVFNAPGTF